MKNMKIRFKVLLILGFVILLVISNIALLTLFTDYFSDNIVENIESYQISNAVKFVDIIEVKLQYQTQIVNSIANNETILKIIKDMPINTLQQINANHTIKRTLLDYSGSMKGIYSVNIFSKRYNEPLNTIVEGSYAETTASFGINNYQMFADYLENAVIYPYGNDVYFNIMSEPSVGAPMLTTLKWISDDKEDQFAVIAMLYRLDSLFENIQKMKSNPAADLFVIDNSANVVYRSSHTLSSQSIDMLTFWDNIYQKKDGTFITTFNDEDQLVTFRAFDSIDWIVVEITPYNQLLSGFFVVQNKIGITIFLITLLMIVLAVLLSNKATDGLKKLLSNIRTIKQGNLMSNVGTSNIVEIEELYTNFEEMITKIKELMTEIEQAHYKERNAELKALQAQINPHFLYNTLDAVYWMSNDKEVGDIISRLGQFFRLSLSKGLDIISVAHELEQVRSFVDIQMMVYKGRFTYTDDIDSKVLNFKVIKLIIQPLVENAILHGFKMKKKDGEIHLSANLLGNNLIFTVTDNGCGIDLGIIESVLNDPEEPKGYGIRNVNDRIKLRYGNEYGLCYEISESGCTVARIIVPAIE